MKIDYDSNGWLPSFLLTWRRRQTLRERAWVLRHYFIAWPLCALDLRVCEECQAITEVRL